MHFHLPKPLHGWREFAGEVGIIVLGVMIALGAEQAIEDLHSRNEARQTRQALDAELGHNLASFDYRLGIQSCAQERLNEFQAIIDREARGERVPLKRDFSPPLTINLRFAIWNVASGEGKSHMPVQVKLQYAMLYDIFSTYEKLRAHDGEYWGQLGDLDFDQRLRPEDIRNAKIAIKRLRLINALLPEYSSLLRLYVDPLHIQQTNDLDEATSKAMAEDRSKFCSSLI